MSSALVSRRRICLLLGPKKSGKTAILRQILDDIEPTLNVENVPTTAPNVNTMRAFLDFDVWDCPGERYDIENLQGLHVNQIGACIFVIDALSFEGDSANQVRRIASAIYKIHRFDSKITFDIFCHKTEGKGDTLRLDLQQDIRNRLTDELHDLADDDPDTLNTGYSPIPIIYHFTSIFQPSIWDALSKIVSRLMPCQSSLEKLLDLLCTNCNFDKVYLFDMELKLYFATDSTPADKVTHELCMEYIDFHWEMDQIYGPDADIPEEAKSRTNSFGLASGNGPLEWTGSLPRPDLTGLRPLRKYASGSVTLSNGIAMAHWQITGDVALVARVASQTLDQAPAVLEHNISTIRQAVSALYDLETRR